MRLYVKIGLQRRSVQKQLTRTDSWAIARERREKRTKEQLRNVDVNFTKHSMESQDEELNTNTDDQSECYSYSDGEPVATSPADDVMLCLSPTEEPALVSLPF